MPEPKFEDMKNEQGEAEPVIEYATKEDCPGIVEVDRDRMLQRFDEYQIPLREFNKEERTEKLEIRLEKGIAEYGNEGFSLVSKISDQVVGYIEFEKNENNVVRIDTISVIRKYQGSGLALELLRRGEEEARKVFNPKKFQAGVFFENTAAVKFWTDEKKAGYKQIGKPEPKVGDDREPILWGGKPSHRIVVEKDLNADE